MKEKMNKNRGKKEVVKKNLFQGKEPLGEWKPVHDPMSGWSWVKEDREKNGRIRYWDPLAGGFVEMERNSGSWENAKGSGGVPYFVKGVSGKEPVNTYGRGGVYNSGERNRMSERTKEKMEKSY